jgi:hypothetical protein
VQYHVTLGYLCVLYVSMFHVLDRYIRIVITYLGRSMYAIIIVFLPVSRSCQINSEFDINRPIFYMTFHYNKCALCLSSNYVLFCKFRKRVCDLHPVKPATLFVQCRIAMSKVAVLNVPFRPIYV